MNDNTMITILGTTGILSGTAFGLYLYDKHK